MKYLIFIFFAFYGHKVISQSNDVRDFKLGTNPLEKSIKYYDIRIDSTYNKINIGRQTNIEVAKSADEVLYLTNQVSHFTDSLSGLLSKLDQSQPNRDNAYYLLDSLKYGDRLEKMTITLYNLSLNSIIDSKKKKELKNVYNNLDIVINKKDWINYYFQHIPTEAATTLFSTFILTYKTGTYLVLKELQKQHKN